MAPSLPLCSTRDAFRLLGKQLPQIESPDSLLYGATAISMHQLENVDPAAVDAKLQFYADVVRGRVRGSQPQAIVAHLTSCCSKKRVSPGIRTITTTRP